MTSKRMFYCLIGVIVLFIGLTAGATYYGAKFLTQKGDDLVDQKLAQQVLTSRSAALQQAHKDIETYAPLAEIAQSIVPQDKDQARTVREIVNIADETGVALTAINFPESALGEVRKKSTKSSKNQPANNPDTSQLMAVEGANGLYAMEITITSSQQPVPYSRLLAFLEGLENNRRTAHVTTIDIRPSEANGNLVTFTIKLNVYIKP